MSEAKRVLDKIEEIAAVSSRNEKEVLLTELLESELGQFVVKWAYDPFITFGLTPVRQGATGADLGFRSNLVVKLLTELSSRKLTGNAAQREVAEVMAAFEPAGAELLFRILAKDLKCGVAAISINKVMPGFIPVFSVMRAQKFEEKRVKKWPQIVEPKLDGYRYTFLCRNGHGGFFSRSGQRQASCDHMVEPMIETALKALNAEDSGCSLELARLLESGANGDRTDLNFMVDGEMIVNESFAETGALRRTSEAAEGARFHVFDIMSYADFDAVGSVGKPYIERRALVEEFVRYSTTDEITKTPRYYANSIDEVMTLFDNFRSEGLEGAMVKNPAGLYDKKKSHGWMKIKPQETEDLPIVGAFPGELNTKYENCLGGLIVRRENKVEVRVGGGFSDEQRKELWQLWLEDMEELDRNGATLDDPSFDDQPRLFSRLIEVEFHEETPDGSLRHPRFKRFRDDKDGEVEDKEAA